MRPPARRALGALGLAGLLVAIATAALAHRAALALRADSQVDVHIFVPTPEAARLLALGEHELWADLAWIRTLVYYGDGMVHQTGMPDVEKLIALVNRLDPRFRKAYIWGSHATTFRHQTATLEEYQASVEVLRRGVLAFPKDWELHWLLGFRLYQDLAPKAATEAEQRRLREEGASYIERAMRLPNAPSNLPLLAANYRSKLGQTERALRELREMILTTEDENAREQLQARFSALASGAGGEALATAAKALDSEWKRELPYVPRSLYILLGPRPRPELRLSHLAEGNAFVVDEEQAAMEP